MRAEVRIHCNGGGAGNRNAGGETEENPTGANCGIEDDGEATIASVGDPSILPEGDSGTIPASPRHALVRALEIAMNDALASGDLPLAQLALATLAKLAGGAPDAR